MRIVPTALLLTILALLPAPPARAFSSADLIDGFMRTVFGSEYPAWNFQANVVKKFTRPALVYIDDRSSARRGGDVAAFVRSLPGLIDGLDVRVVADPSDANYRVYVLNRADYRAVVSREVYGRASSSYAPGKCVVRVVSGSGGITRADAAIVADEGDFLFRRCLVEEVLQGLGPLNDDATLAESMFNDRSQLATFGRFDRHILNMLYHPAVRAGMTREEVRKVLPMVAEEVQARLR